MFDSLKAPYRGLGCYSIVGSERLLVEENKSAITKVPGNFTFMSDEPLEGMLVIFSQLIYGIIYHTSDGISTKNQPFSIFSVMTENGWFKNPQAKQSA